MRPTETLDSFATGSDARGCPPVKAFLLSLALAGALSSAASALDLTPEETTFVQAHPVWRVAGASTPPYQWIDQKGKFRGIAADYLEIIQARLKVRMEIVPAASWTASLEGMRRRESDISMLTAPTPDRESFLAFTEPLLDLPPAIITRSDDQKIHTLSDLAGRHAVVARSYAIHERLAREHPEILLVPRDDELSAITAVALGNADAYVGDLASATDAIEKLGVRNLKVAGDLPYHFPYGIAVRNDWPAAVSILNKAIASISRDEQAAISRRWLAPAGEVSLRRVLLFALPMVIAAVILTLLIANRRLGRALARQRETAAALQASEERWSFALEGAGDGVWDWDVRTNVVFFSPQWKRMLGYEEHELPNQFEEWSKRVHPDDLDATLDAVQRHLRGDAPYYQVEHRMAHRDGSYRWMLARGRVVERDADGNAARMVGTQADITERRQVAEELRQHKEQLEETIRARTSELQLARERLSEMTNRLPGAVYQLVRDHAGVMSFTYCSHGFAEMTGVSAEEAVRNPDAVWASIHPNDLAELARLAEASAHTLTRYEQDLRICAPDGRRWWIRAESDPHTQADGTILWNGAIMDITERKELEEKLAQAKAEAEAANRAKSAFLANMSHEIRTPMNAILGFSRLLLRDDTFTGVARQNLETVQRSGEHLLNLINDILEMSKIEAGRVELRESDFDLYAMLAELEQMFGLRAQERRLRFTIERAGGVPQFVHGDEAKLRQVFVNLIGNAVKFTERGGVSVQVAASESNGAGVRLDARVSDTGPGIAEHEVPRLFQQFEQMAAGHRAGGTGLGLAISREFVRLMGGDIHVTSQPGRGTTFRFDCRLRRSEAAAAKTGADERRILRVLGPPETLRILIADDNAENRDLLQQTLEGVGFETRAVADGLAAVSTFAAWRPRVVLMDLRMPGLDGAEAIRRIRQLQDGAAVAIIAVSASVFEDDRQFVFQAGGDDFLGKPLQEALLFAKLKQFTCIDYEYAVEVTEAPAASALNEMTAEVVSAAILPERRALLRAAATSADLDTVLALLEEEAAHAPTVAAALRARADAFDYQGLLELLG